MNSEVIGETIITIVVRTVSGVTFDDYSRRTKTLTSQVNGRRQANGSSPDYDNFAACQSRHDAKPIMKISMIMIMVLEVFVRRYCRTPQCLFDAVDSLLLLGAIVVPVSDCYDVTPCNVRGFAECGASFLCREEK